MVASTSMINHDLSSWQTSPAPAPATVYWRNIRWRAWERSARSSLIWVAFWALCFFYLIPIGFVQVRTCAVAPAASPNLGLVMPTAAESDCPT